MTDLPTQGPKFMCPAECLDGHTYSGACLYGAHGRPLDPTDIRGVTEQEDSES